MQIVIDRLWNGDAARPSERVTLELRAVAEGLEVSIDAPFHGDPAPPSAAGHTPGLWNYEVVELFLHAAGERYLELEFGPHGHHLALQLDGVRNVVDPAVPIEFAAERVTSDRWRGRALVVHQQLPPGLARWNAHAIHGQGDTRRYLSALPARGSRPDFHRPEVTAALDPALLRTLNLPDPA